MKRILITGKSSYLANQFRSFLSGNENYQIDLISVREGWKDSDFSSYDVVVHMAGLAHSSPKDDEKEKYYAINRDLAIEVARKAKQDGCAQFVFMSSVIVYGSHHTLITKDTPLCPDNFYGDSKKQAEEGILVLQDENFCVSIVRPPMIYGPGSKGNYRLLSRFSCVTPFFPNVYNERSMLYVDNFCACLKGMIDTGAGGIFLPQNKEIVSTVQLVKEIAKVHHHPLVVLKGLNPFISLLRKKSLFNKVFGSLVIDPVLSKFDFEYQIVPFELSIENTERSTNE
ncbi:NAD-dependent epimerase/dehydratase family protein [uncultured Dubosiella sp.]|uniref:NAD-dependent epimerase/dehydratase family protein n=1 Tax=uncultured Dubosiella sp. TaxID=1937011 RepID=UPI00208A6805|nr:NAD-dependent epimerase/dehydratase family protein [uncultured Dubosiella sp.]GJM57286.1 UDP-glucose 4-epimerase [Erysipelotrichaceae bacterium OPF54]